MNLRKLAPVALGLCLGASGAGSLPAQEVSPTQTAQAVNQKLADTVAAHLRQSGVLGKCRVGIAVHDGVADLVGRLQDEKQCDAVIRVVRSVPGVVHVRTRLTLAHGQAARPAEDVRTAQAQAPQGEGQAPTQFPPPPPEQGAGQPGNGIQEPLSIIPPVMAPGVNPQVQPPPMPPYAWPTYAPYNNFSRVAYPQLYPYEAFPFIGPMYPFPKVPPGWRAVTLRWQDGYWWYGREASGHDWWRIRYW